MIDTQESITAKLCSFARAYHSHCGRQKIFDDYLAFDLMGKSQYEEVGQLIENDFDVSKIDANMGFSGKNVYEKLHRYISPIPLSRIAFAERQLREFSQKNDKCQYVICGAGMDTFSFRNANPNIRIFELDHPDTRRYKLERIKALEWNIPKNVSFVPIDFSKDDMTEVLLKAGFDREVPAFFAVLGVTYYLPLNVFEDTVKKIGMLSSANDKLVFDFPDETTLTDKALQRVKDLAKITEKLGEPMQHGFSLDEIENVLEKHHFRIGIHKSPETIQADFFNSRTDGQTAYENIHFILAERN